MFHFYLRISQWEGPFHLFCFLLKQLVSPYKLKALLILFTWETQKNSHTAISRKVVGKKRTRQSRKVLWVVLSSRFLDFSISGKSKKKWHETPRTYVCEKSRFGLLYCMINSPSVLNISQITFRDGRACFLRQRFC